MNTFSGSVTIHTSLQTWN